MKSKSALCKINAVAPIRRLPGSWSFADLRRVLEVLDYDDFASVPEADLEDMALMALQDLEADEAMQVVLADFTENRFTRGQVQNLSEELKEDRAWEEYPDLDDQQSLYNCVDLLNGAFPFQYPKPSATRVHLVIEAPNIAATHAARPLDPATLLRGVSRCQEPGHILNRFFADQVAGAAFPEAAWVVWNMEADATGPDVLEVVFCGSSYWLGEVEEDVDASCALEWLGEK